MADAPKILGTDSLRQAYPKLNSAIDKSNEAITKAAGAFSDASAAKIKAESVQSQFNEIVISGDSSVEAAQARVDAVGNTFTTLKERLDDRDGKIAEKASKQDVDAKVNQIVSGTPKGTYSTYSALTSAKPSGDTGIYVVSSDGKWYYWSGTSWVSGGQYQSAGIPAKGVTLGNISDQVVFDQYSRLTGTEWEVGSIDSQFGTNSAFNNRVRTKTYLPAGGYILRVTDPAIKVNFFFYTLNGYVYTSTSGFSDSLEITVPDAYRVRVVIAYDDNRAVDGTSISEKVDILQSRVTQLEKSISSSNYKSKVIVSGDHVEFNTIVNSESDITIVNGELWTFYPSNDAHTNWQLIRRYRIDFAEKTATWLGEFSHNFGHVNTVDYCPENDTLIMGNGSGDYNLPGKIFLIPNAYSIKDEQQADLQNLAVQIDISSYGLGSKPNLVWGEDNLGSYNICYLITNDQKNIRKLILGKGENNLGYGQFLSGKSPNEFNGTFKVLSSYTQPTKGYDDVIQGGDFFDGVLYTGAGHNGIRYWQQKLLEDGSIERVDKVDRIYGDDGNEVFTTMNGVAVYDGYLFVKNNKGLRVIKM